MDIELPSLDVFVCTVDPKKEPTIEVMNTVISALALDYPPEKLSVYLSDDGGSYVTLYAIKEAWSFAKSSWLPFCKKYGIRSRCPGPYFSSFANAERLLRSDEFRTEEEEIKVGANLVGVHLFIYLLNENISFKQIRNYNENF